MGKAMRKVLHVIESLELGGAERVVIEHATSHDRSRYEPEVCCVDGGGPLAAVLEEIGVPLHVLGRRGRFDPRPTFALARLVARRGIDVVHNHNLIALAVGLPGAVLGGARAIVRTEHNVASGDYRLHRFLSRLASLRENAQIAVSDAVARSRVAERRFPPTRLVTIRNGIDDCLREVSGDRSQVRKELGVSDETVLCLTVGSLTAQKDHENLLQAIAAAGLPDARFAVAGAGPLEEKLAERADELGVADRVLFLGQRGDVPRLLTAADIFVLPSAWEGLPITVLEAMAAGVPCVSTAVGGVPEAIIDGVNGYLVEPHDPAALAEKLRLLAGDAEQRSRFAAAARETYEGGFTARHMVRQTEALYDLAIAGAVHHATAKRIKVVYVIRQLAYGGAERQLLELATRLPRSRFEPVVCSLCGLGPLGKELEEAGVRVVTFNKGAGAFSGTSLALARLVLRERPRILHSYLTSANWRSTVVGRFLRVPVVITSVRNVDVHGSAVGKTIERLLSGLTDRVIVNAGAVGDYVARACAVAPERIRVIYNGISLDRIPHFEQTAAGNSRGGGRKPSGNGDGSSVAMIASLSRKKDHGTFLAAAAQVAGERPDTRFLLVGDGPLRDSLAARVESMGLAGSVTLTGKTDDVGAILEASDVSVLTSVKEGCSNVILESMAAGKPVVATNVGGNSELVDDGVTGYLVPVGDADGIARRVLELLGDRDLGRRMGAAGRERILSRFTAQRMVDDTVGFYTELLNERIPGLIEWIDAAQAREHVKR